MSNKKDYLNKCFSPNWLEVDLETLKTEQNAKEVLKTNSESYSVEEAVAKKEANLEGKHRKDLNTLLKDHPLFSFLFLYFQFLLKRLLHLVKPLL